jgi:hypothetical protein
MRATSEADGSGWGGPVNIMGDFADEMDKKRKALKELLKFIREENDGWLSSSGYNAAVADNETAWEIGNFGEGAPVRAKEDRISAAILDGLIVRTRRDALTAQLNSAKILDLLEGPSRKELDGSSIHEQLRAIKIICLLTLVFVVGLVIDRFF